MRSKSTLVSLCFMLTATIAFDASATLISIQRDYNLYGHLSNEGDACACTSAVNSMLYLQNQYKHKGVDNLIRDGLNDGIDLTDLDDARDDLRDGWINKDTDLRQGMGAPAGRQDIWEQQIYWMEDMEPDVDWIFSGMTGFNDDVENWYLGSNITKATPTFDYMWRELSRGMDVELGIYGTNFGHAMVLTSLKFDDLDNDLVWDSGTENAWIDYLDPNNPSQLFERSLFTYTDGYLGFNWFNGGVNTPSDVWIGRVYAKGIPEPSSLLLLALGLFALRNIRNHKVA